MGETIRARDSPTELTKVQAEIRSLHQGGVSADGPQVEVHVNWQRGERRDSQPGQHEKVCQHNKLQQRRSQDRKHIIYWKRRILCLTYTARYQRSE